MKKRPIRFVLLIIISMLFFLTGCEAGSAPSSDSAPSGDDQISDDDSSSDDDTAGDDTTDDDTTDDDTTDDDTTDDDTADDDSSDDDDDDDNDDNDDDNDDDDNDDLWGSVTMGEGYASSNYLALTYYNYVAASFFDPADFASWNVPVESTQYCDRYYYDYSNLPSYWYFNGGNVTVTGANVSPIQLTPVAYSLGHYYQADYDPSATTNLFDTGDTISFSTTGNGSIPAFTGMVTAPNQMTVTIPANFDSLTTVPAGAMNFAWNSGAGDHVLITVSTVKNLYGQTVTCVVDDAKGSFSVPASLMSDLYSSPDTMTVSLMRGKTDRDKQSGKELDFAVYTYRTRSYIIVK